MRRVKDKVISLTQFFQLIACIAFHQASANNSKSFVFLQSLSKARDGNDCLFVDVKMFGKTFNFWVRRATCTSGDPVSPDFEQIARLSSAYHLVVFSYNDDYNLLTRKIQLEKNEQAQKSTYPDSPFSHSISTCNFDSAK